MSLNFAPSCLFRDLEHNKAIILFYIDNGVQSRDSYRRTHATLPRAHARTRCVRRRKEKEKNSTALARFCFLFCSC